MNEIQHTVLCVDDEENILSALKRLLRKENYRLLTAGSGMEGLRAMEHEEVHLVISDQRMPEMSGVEFLGKIKEAYPDVVRLVLTGYTDVDTITESINKGHIYKLLLKPWNDQNLKLEIRQALEQYDLIRTNQKLKDQVLEQNEALRRMNDDLERRVQERTMELELRNHALELSRAVLEDLPLPIMGVSSEGMIVLLNHKAQGFAMSHPGVEIGHEIASCLSEEVSCKVQAALAGGRQEKLSDIRLQGARYDIEVFPLSGSFRGRGGIVTFSPVRPCPENADLKNVAEA